MPHVSIAGHSRSYQIIFFFLWIFEIPRFRELSTSARLTKERIQDLTCIVDASYFVINSNEISAKIFWKRWAMPILPIEICESPLANHEPPSHDIKHRVSRIFPENHSDEFWDPWVVSATSVQSAVHRSAACFRKILPKVYNSSDRLPNQSPDFVQSLL